LWIGQPLSAVVFIAADMDVLVGENNGHLLEKGGEEGIGFLPGRIEEGIFHTEPDLRVVGTGGARQFRVAQDPAAGVAAEVYSGYSPDPPEEGLINPHPDMLLGIVGPRGTLLMEATKNLAFHPEPLVIGYLPMEDD